MTKSSLLMPVGAALALLLLMLLAAGAWLNLSVPALVLGAAAALLAAAVAGWARRRAAAGSEPPSVEPAGDDQAVELSRRSELNAVAAAEVSHCAEQLNRRLRNQVAQVRELTRLSTTMDEAVTESATTAAVAAVAAKQSRKAGSAGHEALGGAIETVIGINDRFAASATHVASLSERTRDLLRVVGLIREIASQSKILALNAGIEAAQAGDQASGFAVVANEMSGLATRTGTSVSEVQEILARLDEHVSIIVAEITALSAQMQPATETLRDIVSQFEGIMRWSQEVEIQVGEISAAAIQSRDNLEQISASIREVEGELQSSLEDMAQVAQQASQLSRSAGDDNALWALLEPRSYHHPYLEICRRGAEQVAAVFRDAIAAGELSEADLFDRDYQPIPGTEPVRYRSRYDAFTDSALPPVQRPLAKSLPDVAFACAVDDNGYTPTDSSGAAPTGDAGQDPETSRDKRIDLRFKTAGKDGDKPASILTYKRDLGDTLHVVSVPIRVNGRHWGGFHVGYPPCGR